MKEIIINEKTKEKVTLLFQAIHQHESQIVNLIETYLDAVNEKGKWKLSEDFSKIVLEEEPVEEEAND